MSISVFEPRQSNSSNARTVRSTNPSFSSQANSSYHASDDSSHSYTYNPFGDRKNADHSVEPNPVADLIPDEVYMLLRSNDMINEKAVRDYVIRRAFHQLREQQNIKTAEAIEKIKEVYPYLQLDTIRKIIYRISPSGRKMMAAM